MAKSCKFYKQQRQVSYDNGVTWIPLDEYQKGALIEVNSSDCTSPSPKIYRWTQTEDTVCVENLSSTYTKYYVYKKQESTDNGSTWNDVYPLETKPYGSPIGTYDTLAECEGLFKLLAHYSDASTYLVACDSSNELTVETIRAHSTSFTAMTNAVVGSCVSSIGELAFFECENLTSVTIHNSVTTIGNRAFDCCKNLTNITIPNSVTSIGQSAFSLCSGLTSIDIPSSVTTIENNTFQQCYSLTDVIIPNNVTSIGQAAFYECSGITSVSIGTSVVSIGDGAFEYCESLTAIDIPNNVASIGEFAFQGCRSLTSLTIPSSVASIDNQAFAFCSGLTSITVESTTPPTIGEYDVFTFTNNCPIYVPSASVNAYKSASGWSNYANRIQAIP